MAKKRGRPKADSETVFRNRHVVNVSDEQQEALEAFRRENGIARLTDAIRQLLIRALKSEGLL